jgi:SepF-like predicted cell division protein (DUF552 family)
MLTERSRALIRATARRSSYALVDRTGQHDLARADQPAELVPEVRAADVPGVSEVATVGGMVRQYQIVVDPEKLRAYGIPLQRVMDAVRNANREVGGSVLELAEAEYMVRTRGYLTSLEDIELIAVTPRRMGTPVLLRDIARVQIGPEMRRVVADLDGEGEITGGIVVMRYGENALATIEAVKERIDELRAGLPDGVEIVETYDRSELILSARSTTCSQADRGVHRRRAGLFRVPVASALGAGGNHQPAARHAGRLHRHAPAGHQRQHHVPGRHRHRHRRDGGCGDRDDRERAQASGAFRGEHGERPRGERTGR